MKTSVRFAILVLALGVLVLIVRASQPAYAAGPWYVAPGGDDGYLCTTAGAPCATINGAIGKASAGDTIYVAAGTYIATGSSSGDPIVWIDRNLTISGGWDTSFATQTARSTIDGRGECCTPGIVVEGGVTATVARFVIHDMTGGEGIRNKGTLALNDSVLRGNVSVSIDNEGALTMNSSVVAENSTVGIVNRDTAILNSSAIVRNMDGGISTDSGFLVLNNSTVSENWRDSRGGGIYVYNSTVALNSSTISGNSCRYGPGSGGIYVESGTVTLRNTVIAGNSHPGAPDCSGTIGSLGYNLIGDTSGCTFTPATGDLTNVEADLGSRTGFPPYYPLLSRSPAIESGDPSGCVDHLNNDLLFDQRGMPRLGRCDIGAYESDLAVNKQGSGSYTPGTTVSYVITLESGADTDILGVYLTDTLPISLTFVADSLSASGGVYAESGGTITWSGTVPAGGTTAIWFQATVSEVIASCSLITNKVQVEAGAGYGFQYQVAGATPCVCNVAKHADNPVLSVGPVGSWDSDDVWGPVVLKEGSGYKMWYTGDDGSNPSQIGLATSADGVNWTKAVGNPVLSPSGDWEARGIVVGSVISQSGFYEMWYTGYHTYGNIGSGIGYATSPDGVTWNKSWGYPGTPSIDEGFSGQWDEAEVRGPTVIKRGSAYHVWYTGCNDWACRIGHATSMDGKGWSKDLGNPVLDIGPPGDWDWLDVYAPSVVQYGDTYILWYSGETLPQAWQTGYALSTDGSRWMRGGMVVPEGPPGAFDANGADDASVILDNGTFKIWYSGHDGSRYGIGYATADLCDESGAVQPICAVYLPAVLKGWQAQYPCPAYYGDSFDDATSGWPVGENSDRKTAYTDGQYQIWLKRSSQSWMVTPGVRASDFAVAVSARRVSGSGGAYGIIFGIDDDWSELYEVILGSNDYSIWKYDSGWSSLRDWTSSEYINGGTDWNRLKVIRDRSDIAVYVNDQHLATIVDGSFTGFRRIGLVAYAFRSGPIDARFDDFALYPSSCGPNAAGVEFEMGMPGVHQVPVPPGLDNNISSKGGSR